jgi:hypothetical protein
MRRRGKKRNRGVKSPAEHADMAAAQDRRRVELARVAARLMAEEAIHGFAEAKSKALDRLGMSERPALPSNQEIEAELAEYQALFQASEHQRWIRAKREAAVAAMELLVGFQPHLVGSVLRGTAPEDAEITLHVFADPPELVPTFLYERGIRWALDSWIGRFGGGREFELPMYRMALGDECLRLVVFPDEGLPESPRSPVDGKPMRRASAREVHALLDDEAGE